MGNTREVSIRTKSVVLGLLGFWWLATRRTWQRNSSLVMSAITYWAIVWSAARRPHAAAISTYALAAVLIVAISYAARRSSVFISERFALVEIPRADLALARAIGGNTLRTCLIATAALVFLARVVSDNQRRPALVLGLVEGALVAALILAASYLAEDGDRRGMAWITLAVAILTGVAAALTLVPAPPDAPPVPGGCDRSLFLGGCESPRAWLAYLLTLALAVASAVALIRSLLSLPDAGEAGTRRRRSVATPTEKWAWRVFGPALGREIISFFRVPRLRTGALVAALVALAAVVTSSPRVLTVVFVGWIGFSHNLLGADWPLDGVERYAIAGIPMHRVFRNRQRMIGLMTAIPALLAVAATTLYARDDESLPAFTRAGWGSVACLYGWSAYRIVALWGERESLRVWHPIARTQLPQPEEAGSFAESMRVIGGLVAVIVMCGAIYAVSMRITSHGTDEPASITPMTLAAAIQLAGVAVVRALQRRASARV